MRFIATTSLVTIVGATDLVCSEDVVRTADSQGFVSYIYNCVWSAATTIGPQACLTAFIDENATDNPHPITNGSCRDAYQSLVDGWATGIPSNCPLNDILEGSNPVKSDTLDDCVRLGIGDTQMTNFYRDTGFFPFVFCTNAEVRAYAAEDTFHWIIDYNWNEGAGWSPQGYSACDYCNTLMQAPLPTKASIEAGSDAALIAECLAIPPTAACLASTIITNARKIYRDCAGQDILYQDPSCSADAIAVVESLIPAPYYTFAECAYNPAMPFCVTIQAYLDQIEADTSSVDCLACFTDLQSYLEALAANDTDDVCGTDVFSEECLEYQSDALTAFETCSGYTLNTVSATVAPSVTTSAAPVDDDTTAGLQLILRPLLLLSQQQWLPPPRGLSFNGSE